MSIASKHMVIATSEFPPQPGGIGNHTYNLALQLSKHGFHVIVIADQRSMDGLEEAEFDQKLPFVVKRIAIRRLRFFMYFQRLVILFKTVKRCQHIIATGKFSLWSVAMCSLFFKRPYLAVVHGTEVNFKKPLLRMSVHTALRRFKTIVAVSNYTKQLIAHLGLNVVVIPNGFAAESWSTEATRPVQMAGSPKLITVGNVTSRKGQQQVIRHLPVLLQAFPDLHYHCVGLPTEAETFQQLAHRLGVDRHVTFHGRVDASKLQALLSSSDIFVMLSQETETGDVEGFGIAILEANSLGVPAIGSKGCGIEDAIHHGHSGILIDATDSQAFLEAVKVLQRDADRYREGALAWAKNHEWSAVIPKYLELLQRCD